MDAQILQLIIWVVLTLVPLIPTYVTHKFLESSSAYKGASSRIKLGGAIAAYFILLGTAFTSYNYMYTDSLSGVRTEIVGTWNCRSTVIESENTNTIGETFTSLMYVSINSSSGKISIYGMTDNGKSWDAEEVILTENKLIYIFDSITSDTTGIASLKFSNFNHMYGNYVISGAEGKGSVDCDKAS